MHLPSLRRMLIQAMNMVLKQMGEFRITDKFTINATLGLLSSEVELGGQ
jgi:hypothetical protein